MHEKWRPSDRQRKAKDRERKQRPEDKREKIERRERTKEIERVQTMEQSDVRTSRMNERKPGRNAEKPTAG